MRTIFKSSMLSSALRAPDDPAAAAAAALNSNPGPAGTPPPAESGTPAVAAAEPAAAGEQPEGTAAKSEDGAAASAEPAVAAPPAKPADDWKDRRIAQLTGKLREAQEKLEAKPEGAAAAGEAIITNQAELDRLVEAQAERALAAKQFNESCNAAAEAGRQAFGAEDFNKSVAGLVQLVDMKDPSQAATYNQFINAALATGKAPELLFALGRDQNEAARLMLLPPVQLGIEMARLAAKPAPAPISGAPKPIEPIGSRRGPHTSIAPSDPVRADNLSTAEWMVRRNAEVKARQQAQQS